MEEQTLSCIIECQRASSHLLRDRWTELFMQFNDNAQTNEDILFAFDLKDEIQRRRSVSLTHSESIIKLKELKKNQVYEINRQHKIM